MQVRHRIPTIFNLSMVDVLCCALGCVILLWLINLREAKQRAVAVGETSHRLEAAQRQLDEAKSQVVSLTAERDELSQRYQAALKERNQLGSDLDKARAALVGLDKDLATLETQKTKAEDRLARLSRQQQVLSKEKADVLERLADLEALLRAKESQIVTSGHRAGELGQQIREALAREKSLQLQVDKYRSKLVESEVLAEAGQAEASNRKKDLADANRNIALLEREKKLLLDQANRTRAAVENRFEGIALTGRRVIFLVDMSGSMELVDERTPDPQKWVGVRETLAKVMRSLPSLEKFQVIIFSEKMTFLLGNEGQWLDYDPQGSTDRVYRALVAIKPLGATNMYDAFESAFRYRALGLDTIYVLSDGLPNTGPGLTVEQANLKETERSDILARHIRNLLRTNWNRELPGRPRVRINAIGFFYESPDVGAFLWALARENDGSFVGMSKP